MDVDFDMFGALMLYRVGGEVDGTDIVIVDNGSVRERVIKLNQQGLKPTDFRNTVSDGPVFGFGT